jgi:hypothetical protein
LFESSEQFRPPEWLADYPALPEKLLKPGIGRPGKIQKGDCFRKFFEIFRGVGKQDAMESSGLAQQQQGVGLAGDNHGITFPAKQRSNQRGDRDVLDHYQRVRFRHLEALPECRQVVLFLSSLQALRAAGNSPRLGVAALVCGGSGGANAFEKTIKPMAATATAEGE